MAVSHIIESQLCHEFPFPKHFLIESRRNIDLAENWGGGGGGERLSKVSEEGRTLLWTLF